MPAQRRFTTVCILLLLSLLATSLHAQGEASTGIIKVKAPHAELILGKDVVGYVPEGAVLRPRQMQNGYYMVEILIDGMFRSLAWIRADKVEEARVPLEQAPDTPTYAFPDLPSLKEGKENEDIAEQYVVTGYYSDDDGSLETEGLEKKGPATEDHKLVKEYHKQVGESTDYGKPKIGLKELPDDVDLDAAKAPKNKPEDPIVSKEVLPVTEERTEQTLGRGTAKWEISREQKIGSAILLILIGGMIMFFLYASSENKKKKKRFRK